MHLVPASIRNAALLGLLAAPVISADTAPDSQTPTASVTFPTGGTVSGGVVTVTASANDNVGVTQVEFYIDGVLRCADANSPYSCDWDVTNHKRGVSHGIYVKAYDAALNVGQSATVSVAVDNGR